jgi:hypothetical protein
VRDSRSPQRRQVDRLLASGLRLLVVLVLGFGGQGREQMLGHRRLLVRDDVVRPAPYGGGGAQLLPHHRTGEDSSFVLQRDAGYLPLPRVLAPRPGRGRLAGIGRELPVRAGCGCGWAAPSGEVGQGPPGCVEAVAALQAVHGLRLADVQAVGGNPLSFITNTVAVTSMAAKATSTTGGELGLDGHGCSGRARGRSLARARSETTGRNRGSSSSTAVAYLCSRWARQAVI